MLPTLILAIFFYVSAMSKYKDIVCPDWLHALDCDTNTFPLSFYDFLNLPQVSLHVFVWIHPKVYFSSNAETVRYCDSCDKSQEVCVALTEDIPVCNKIQDPLDPTGCGGLCMLDRQVCLRIDTDAFKYVFQKKFLEGEFLD